MKKVEDKRITEKTLAFTIKFNKFIVHNPDIAKKIPNNACIIFRDNSDKKYNIVSGTLASQAVANGETCISATPTPKFNSWRIERLIHA